MTADPGSNDVVYYYANHDRKYLALAWQSIESLRRYNPDLNVLLFTDSSAVESVRRHFRFDRFEVKILTTNNRNMYLNKWLCLGGVIAGGFDRALMIDVDTIFHEDAMGLFALGEGVNLAARLEAGMGVDDPRPAIDHDLLAAARDRASARPCPVFNTGVVVLDRDGMRMAYESAVPISRLMRQFRQAPETYPCANWHVIEEIACAIQFGTLDHFSWRLLPPARAPFFEELSLSGSHDPGILIHYWTINASLKTPNPYADFEGSLPVGGAGGPLP